MSFCAACELILREECRMVNYDTRAPDVLFHFGTSKLRKHGLIVDGRFSSERQNAALR